VTSMQEIMGHGIAMESVCETLVESFADVFGCQPGWIEKDQLNKTMMNLNARPQRQNEVSRSFPSE
jgi:hypothetical protein